MKKLYALLLVQFLFLLFVHTMVAQKTIDDAFFDKVDFIGAFGEQDWTEGWANWTPQNTVYPAATITIPAGNITANTTWKSSSVTKTADFTHTKLTNAFFEPVGYVGAFGSTDWTAGWSNWTPQTTVYPATTDIIPAGDITVNTTLSASKVYLLNGWVYVKAGATLTIEAGTVIRGDKSNKGSLIIEKGAKIIAEGTADHPIVFTSNQNAGSRSFGDWGGIIVLGNAKVNKIDPVVEGGPTSTYGGSDDADSSGILKYVRIEFPGIAFQPDKEINGLTFGGVGSRTKVDYVQVSFSGDDSYEWFGGSVSAKHLIAFRGWDDDWDTDYGFRGMVQFGVSLRDPDVADAVSGSNSFESDNDATGTTDAPVTEAVFSNITSIGPLATPTTVINANYRRAMHIRRNSRLSIFNSVFAGYSTGLFIDGTASQGNATAGTLEIENSILAGCTKNFAAAFDSLYFTDASRNNLKLATNADLNLTDAFNLSAPNFIPGLTAYLLDGWVYVKDGATLTIEAGAIIRGDKAHKGALIIEKGAKIMAEGTSLNPIIFTSNQDAGSRSFGDWGGIILLGKATVNKVDPVIEGGPTSTYGGTDDSDNTGIFKYVRIEFPGIAFQPDKEINGLTLGAVGSATVVDYVQVSFSGDDSYEWFGGTVNAKHLVAFRGWDDDWDTDYGFRGMVQFGVSLKDPAIADAVSGSNSFESDNDGTGSTDAPVTQALFSNISSFGPLSDLATIPNPNHRRALHIRRNSKLNIYNSLFAGYSTGLFIDGSASQANATGGDLKIMNTYLAGCKDFYSADFDSTFFVTEAFSNEKLATNEDLMVADPFNLISPDFMPETGSPVLTASVWYEDIPSGIADPESEKSVIAVFPNPFSGSAKIGITTLSVSDIQIRIYDVTGSLVSTVAHERRSAGYHEFDVHVPKQGVYFANVLINQERQVVKLVSR